MPRHARIVSRRKPESMTLAVSFRLRSLSYARVGLGEARPGSSLVHEVLERDDLPRRRDEDADFLLLQRREPAMPPAPETNVGREPLVGLLLSEAALEEEARVVVPGEGRGMA